MPPHLVRAALPLILLVLGFTLSSLERKTVEPTSLVALFMVGLAAFWEGRQTDHRVRYVSKADRLVRIGEASPAGLIATTLLVVGWVMLERLDSALALRQAVWILFAFGVRNFLSNSRLRMVRLQQAAIPLAVLTAGLQTTVFLAGTERHGAKNWVYLGPLSVQPGEFVKLSLVLFLAAMFCRFRLKIREALSRQRKGFPHPSVLLLTGVVVLVEATLVWQNDLGMALLSGLVFLAMFYVATGRVAICAFLGAAGAVGAALAYLLFPHVQVRVASWLFPFSDPLGTGYQSVQAIYALAAGRMLGQGWGRGEPDLIPEAATDFLSVALVEELGLLGFLAILLLLALLIAWCFVLALNSRDEFSAFTAIGLTTIFAVQTFLVVGGCLRLIPLTGMTLPFLSYGGSSLVASMASLGLLEKIHREQRRLAR